MLIVFTVMIAIPLGIYTGMRDPFVQTLIARATAGYLSNQFQTEVRIGAFFIDLDLSLKMEGVYVADQKGQPLLDAASIRLRLASHELKRSLKVSSLHMQNIAFNLKKYEGEADLNLQFLIDFFAGEPGNDTVAGTPFDYMISLNDFSLRHAKFRYWDQNKDKPGEPGMDYAHLNFSDIDVRISDFSLRGDSINCQINHLTAKDTSGLFMRRFRGGVAISPRGLQVDGLEAVLNNSQLNLDLIFSYNAYPAFLDFIDSVDMDIMAHPSKLDMADIGYFAPLMFDMTNKLSFAGKIRGPVSNLATESFSFSYGSATVFSGDVSLSGLPDIYNTFAELNIKRFETEVDDLKRFALPGEMESLPLPEQIVNLGHISIYGLFSGYYNDFNANTDIRTGAGNIKSNLAMRQHKDDGLFYYDGRLQTDAFNLGKFLNTPQTLGRLNMNIWVKGKGLEAHTADMNLSGKVERIAFLDNDFTDIELSGDLTGSTFNGGISIDDPKLKLDFLGRADFIGDEPVFDFEANIAHADLYQLHLLSQDTLMHLETDIRVNFVGLDPDQLTGSIQIDDTRYQDSRNQYNMDTFLLVTRKHEVYPRRLSLQSDFFKLDLGGEIDLANFAESFRKYTSHYVQFRNFGTIEDSLFLQDFYIDLQIKDTEVLTNLFMPALSLAPGSRFSGVFTSRDHVLNTTFRTDQLAYGTLKFNNLIINSQSDQWGAGIIFSGSELIFRDSTDMDPAILGIEQPELQLELANDSLRFGIRWADNRRIARNRGDLHGYYAALPDQPHELRITDSDLIVNDSVWRIHRGNRIIFTDDYIKLHQLEIRMGDQKIALEGNLPFSENDTLTVNFLDWELDNFNLLTLGYGLSFQGLINGELLLSNIREQPAFISNLRLSELYMNRERLGEARILSTWNNLDESLYLNTQVINMGNIASSRMLNLRGFYYPSRQDENLRFDLDLDNFRMRTIAPFLDGLLSQMEGLASGKLTIGGLLDKPEIAGNISMMRTAFKIDYLNTKYSLVHDFEIEPTRISFDRLMLYDTLGNRAVVSGAITHDHLSDFRLNLNIKPEDFLALNTDRSMNELFYGSAVVSGDMGIRGAFNDIGLNINAITRRGTFITIPLSAATTVYDNDFIVFVQDEQAIDTEPEVERTKPQGFSLNLETTVTPEAGLRIFLPDNMGNLEATGSGNIKLGVSSAGDFSLLGDYNIRAGQFNFMFENLVRRRFELMEGGRISWTGDPLDANIDIRGMYRLKTSVASLGPGIDSTMRSRVNVEAVIHLTDQLFNPNIKFSIRLPNVDPETRQMVFAVLDTTNDAMMTQQILSLLVLGSFSYTMGESASLGSSSISVLSNQLSNWLSQISKDFDIGVHYRPGDRLTNEELEVALSTQLFNDRVTIDGNFGVIGNRHHTQNASNIVGDVDINVLLTPDGRLRMKAFNHSNTSTWFNSRAYDNYAPYTQGVGFSYRQEFDRFGDLFRRLRKKKPNESSP